MRLVKPCQVILVGFGLQMLGGFIGYGFEYIHHFTLSVVLPCDTSMLCQSTRIAQSTMIYAVANPVQRQAWGIGHA